MEAEKVIELSPLVKRITAGNGSVFTGPGTNTYLVGIDEITVIDPGPAIKNHIDAILSASPKIKQILVTHTCLLYTSPSPRDLSTSRMPSSA